MTAPGIGIIGPGAIGHAHANALAALGVPVAAVAGPNRDDLDEFAQTHTVPGVYTETADLLSDPRVDAVIIAAPSPVHSRLSRLVLSAGKPVLCEVPLALDAEDARQVVHLADERRLPFGVAHTLRYWEPHRLLAAELTAMGRPALHVIARSLQLRQVDTGWTGKKRDWTDSAVWHHGSHAVDAALWFLGDVRVSASCARGREWTNGSVMDASFHLTTDDGRMGTVDLSYHSRRPKSDYLVISEDHTWEIDGATLYRDGQVCFEGLVDDVQASAMVAQDRAFLRAIGGDPRDLFMSRQALPALDVLAVSVEGLGRLGSS